MDFSFIKDMGLIKFSVLFILTMSIYLQTCGTTFAVGNMETKLIFYPINRNMSPVRLDLQSKLQDTYFYSNDGIKLNAWYIKAKDDKPTVIYCHGQGENISLWQDVAQTLSDNGYGVFMLDYRGHGRSSGSPTETGLYVDLESAVKYLKDFEHIPQDNVILWGRSLGGAVVTDVASRDRFKGVILESTFTNIRAVGIHLSQTGMIEGPTHFWSCIATKFAKYLPITQKFDSEHKIYKISSPLLIGHSVNDETVPVQMSYELARHNPKAQLFISKTGSHHSSDWFIPKALEFLGYLS
jgi:fermentation-respiration switch protein FrsA (DUF1100 family)